jgi:hypothetical protein
LDTKDLRKTCPATGAVTYLCIGIVAVVAVLGLLRGLGWLVVSASFP